MKIHPFLCAIPFFLAIAVNPTSVLAEGCKLENNILVCNTSGSTPQDILTSFISKETLKTLQSPLDETSRFSKNGSLEAYRKSMEVNWRVINRLARNTERQRQRGRIGSEEFQAFSQRYESAKETYNAALNFYRQLLWQGYK
jgi:hypothetical protein